MKEPKDEKGLTESDRKIKGIFRFLAFVSVWGVVVKLWKGLQGLSPGGTRAVMIGCVLIIFTSLFLEFYYGLKIKRFLDKKKKEDLKL